MSGLGSPLPSAPADQARGAAARGAAKSAPAQRVCFPFIGDLIGGSYISSLLLAQHLDRSRYEPVIVLHEEGHFARELRDQGIAYDLLPLRAFVGTAPGLSTHVKAISRTLPALHKYLRRRGISIVHTNEWPLHQTWAVPARLAGCAFVWHQRGMLSVSRLDTLLRARAHRVLCVSHYIENQLPETLRPRSAVVDSPFDTAADASPDQGAARRALREELAVDPDVPVVGFFGNLWEVKRPQVFIDAAAAIHDALGGRAIFVIFGDDREGRAGALQAHAHAQGLRRALRFMGFRTPGPYWIGACDLMLAPAVGDAFPRTVVEAALAGVPVVAADAGGHPEIIDHGKTGILVAPDDPAALAAAALTLLRDRSWARAIASQARQAARRRFSAETHALCVQDQYDQILARKPQGLAEHRVP